MTALLTVYATTSIAQVLDLGSFIQTPLASRSWSSYFVDLGLNLALILTAFMAWRLVRTRPILQYSLLGAITVVAVERFLMLGQAVAGLFVRPRLNGILDKAVGVALAGAAFMLGLVLSDGIHLARGVSLGAATFVAQVVVGAILTRGFPTRDRVHLAFAQQNGITAIILALLLEAQFDGVVAVVAPAIVTVNLIHFGTNALIDRFLVPGPVDAIQT